MLDQPKQYYNKKKVVGKTFTNHDKTFMTCNSCSKANPEPKSKPDPKH